MSLGSGVAVVSLGIDTDAFRRAIFGNPAQDHDVVRRWIFILVLVLAFDGAALWFWRQHKERRFNPLIREAALKYQLPPALVKAVIWKESDFDPNAVGKAGEIGLMQLMDEAAHEWAGSMHLTGFAHEHVFDPRTNTLAGAYYLSKVMRRYPTTDDPVTYALADYNAGRGNVLKWMTGPARTNSAAFRAQIGFPSTRAYVDAIRQRYAEYRTDFR